MHHNAISTSLVALDFTDSATQTETIHGSIMTSFLLTSKFTFHDRVCWVVCTYESLCC